MRYGYGEFETGRHHRGWHIIPDVAFASDPNQGLCRGVQGGPPEARLDRRPQCPDRAALGRCRWTGPNSSIARSISAALRTAKVPHIDQPFAESIHLVTEKTSGEIAVFAFLGR